MFGGHRNVLLGLAVTQIIGWGSTFYMPSVLGRAIQTDLGLSSEIVFGGITVMLAVSAVIGPRVGRAFDMSGARPIMALGSVVAALALGLMSQANGPVLYLAAWGLIGLAMPMMLYTGAFTALAQVTGNSARRAITTLTFFTGFSSLIFWPLTNAVEPLLGWRTIVLLYATAHLLICLPLHLTILPKVSDQEAATAGIANAHVDGQVPHEKRGVVFALMALALTFYSFISWGLQLHVIDVLKEIGIASASAVFIGALTGPASVFGRVVELVLISGRPAIMTGLASAALLPISFLFLFVGGASVMQAAIFALLFGMANGLMTVARASMPLELFGRRHYGSYVGRLSLPLNIMAAISPVILAAVVHRAGVMPGLWLSLAAAFGSLAGMVALVRFVRAQVPPPTPTKAAQT